MTPQSTATRLVPSMLIIASAAFLASSPALAAEKAPPRAKDTGEAATAVEGRVAAPNARLAALIAAGGNIIEQKGVQSVARIAQGVYCIRPTASSGVDPNNSIAVVSVEYFYSQFSEVVVQWAKKGSGCGSDRIGVYTLGDFNLDAKYTFSNDVGFSIYVP
jgi:hypothetical protein